jgi:hypothetical protein
MAKAKVLLSCAGYSFALAVQNYPSDVVPIKWAVGFSNPEISPCASASLRFKWQNIRVVGLIPGDPYFHCCIVVLEKR